MTALGLKEDSVDKILHDLRGPIFNIAGFQSELNDSFRQLTELFDNYCESLTDVKKEEFRDLFENDIDHCLNYTSKSLETLIERVDKLEHRLK
ncbi:hypothetical protein N9850_06170 [Granulosicoccus sp.]|jgi:BMFP domain-containing protein YqiC|nr:hypothetical protein [Granulosicoccus sp.]MDB4223339.1 hypothetical protein [Granulosicoccus sp.]